MWTWILLMKYLEISNEELRNHEKDWRETNLVEPHTLTCHTCDLMDLYNTLEKVDLRDY